MLTLQRAPPKMAHLYPPAGLSSPSPVPASPTMLLRPPSEESLGESSRSAQRELLVDDEDDPLDPFSVDPALRLRTVKTAHSVIAESIRSEQMAESRARRKRFIDGLKRRTTLRASSLKESIRRRTISDIGTEGRSRASTVGTDGGLIPASPSLPPPPRTSEPEIDSPTSNLQSFFDRLQAVIGVRGKTRKPPMHRRTVFVGIALPDPMLHASGEPIARFCRNKVRTSKYTIFTFLPKNLFEQFHRVANIYFLALVILQLFSIFGAPNAQIGMLPLLFILGVTAIKDGIEDWRRATLDNEVNNAATTKLEGWRNVNQPADARSVFAKAFGIGKRGFSSQSRCSCL